MGSPFFWSKLCSGVQLGSVVSSARWFGEQYGHGSGYGAGLSFSFGCVPIGSGS